MSPQQRILIIRLSEKLNKNPAYAKNIGIEIKLQTKNKQLEKLQ